MDEEVTEFSEDFNVVDMNEEGSEGVVDTTTEIDQHASTKLRKKTQFLREAFSCSVRVCGKQNRRGASKGMAMKSITSLHRFRHGVLQMGSFQSTS